VVASGSGVVGRCTNVEVRQCGGSGVLAYMGGSITLIGAKTTVHDNCTKGESGAYGLVVYNANTTIQLVSPLTKEQVSKDNGGGGDWGAVFGGDINQIKTISQTEMGENGDQYLNVDAKIKHSKRKRRRGRRGDINQIKTISQTEMGENGDQYLNVYAKIKHKHPMVTEYG
jgi:hypothetical protein